MRLTARETFSYDGVTRLKGASFNAPDHDAAILQMIGKADVVATDDIATRGDPVVETDPPRRGRRKTHLTEDPPPAA